MLYKVEMIYHCDARTGEGGDKYIPTQTKERKWYVITRRRNQCSTTTFISCPNSFGVGRVWGDTNQSLD